jgi:hypothetical protein
VIAPPRLLHTDQAPGGPAPNPDTGQGWIRRIDQVRADVRRQLEQRTTQLEQALEEAWQLLDAGHRQGSDREIDTLRVLHADLRRPGFIGAAGRALIEATGRPRSDPGVGTPAQLNPLVGYAALASAFASWRPTLLDGRSVEQESRAPARPLG